MVSYYWQWSDHGPSHLNVVAVFIGIVSGLLAHHGLFVRGNGTFEPPGLFMTYASLLSGPLWAAGLFSTLSYITSLLVSIITYRIWFHALTRAGFKGPLLRTSKIWHVWACRDHTNHLFLDQLNKKYGDFVRTGPSEITIYHPEVFIATDGPRTTCVKSDWYDLLWPESSLLTTRDRAVYDARRRDWKLGFSPQGLLDKAIEADVRAGRPSNMRNYFYWLGFDFMGDFVMSSPLTCSTTTSGTIWSSVCKEHCHLSMVNPAPWLIQIAFRVAPRVYEIGDWFQMTTWTHQQIRRRLEDGFEKTGVPDLVHYLLEQKGEPRTTESMLRMRGDSLNAMVAGNEPIPAVLIGNFSELFSEGLRLYPVLPTGGSRQTVEEGVTIGGVYIPPYTKIVSPRFSIQRREDCFEMGNDFVPERWTTHREMIRNAAAFSPWGESHHSCIARAMAHDMLRIVTFQLVKKYRFRMAPDEIPGSAPKDMKDQLAPQPGNLSLCFELR
ncbi:cytochrome P450 [Cryphonectria parasitica EP155]|uniref:Cytochrome P450 n=1 Tax=Cryphonectria parasitica (strain ATCC 38755 / EP155) TaxID=660469 RepID=A0A9P4Y7S2_CRYP1|nr:cytochrome P450 [Cryphonectria parasitica EP155]KAF3767922.1 cytochrome P450 [Cryphonectria parasitica EP155]